MTRTLLRAFTTILLVLAPVLGVAAGTPPSPQAEDLRLVAQMSPGRSVASAVYTGTHTYQFGGYGNPGSFLRSILRFDPEGAQLATMAAELPQNVSKTSAVWTGQHAFIFGGSIPGGQTTRDIVRYTPSTDTVTLMGARMPTAVADTSAVWSGQHAYVFGNDGAGGYRVVRYDPVADQVQVMAAALPQGTTQTSAVWIGGAAYVFGGANFHSLDHVVKYDPVADTATVVGHLPRAVEYSSAVAAGGVAYLFGGLSCAPGCVTVDVIQRFDPATNQATLMGARLPSARHQTSATWSGLSAHVFGGCCGPDREVLQYTPDLQGSLPSPPRALTASTGPGAGQIALAWQRPSDAGGNHILSYKVYHAGNPGGPFFLRGTVGTTAYTDSGLPEGAWRYYRVTAATAFGEGPPSDVAGARSPAAPGAPRSPTAMPALSFGLSGLTPGGGMSVRWQAPADDGGLPVTAYLVKRTACGAEREFRLGNVTSFSDTGACLTGPNTYTIQAVNAVRPGPGASVCAYTHPWSATLPPPGGRCG